MIALAVSLLLAGSSNFSSCPVDAGPIAPISDALAAAPAPACANLPSPLGSYVTLHIPVTKYDCRAPVRGLCNETYTNLSLPMMVLTGRDGSVSFEGAPIGPDCTFSRSWNTRGADGSYFAESIKGYVDSDGSFVVTSYVRQQGVQYALDPRPTIQITEESSGPARGWFGSL
jgi:hypothetical protein